MTRISKKIIAVFLSALMAFSALSAVPFVSQAAATTTQTLKAANVGEFRIGGSGRLTASNQTNIDTTIATIVNEGDYVSDGETHMNAVLWEFDLSTIDMSRYNIVDASMNVPVTGVSESTIKGESLRFYYSNMGIRTESELYTSSDAIMAYPQRYPTISGISGATSRLDSKAQTWNNDTYGDNSIPTGERAAEWMKWYCNISEENMVAVLDHSGLSVQDYNTADDDVHFSEKNVKGAIKNALHWNRFVVIAIHDTDSANAPWTDITINNPTFSLTLEEKDELDTNGEIRVNVTAGDYGTIIGGSTSRIDTSKDQINLTNDGATDNMTAALWGYDISNLKGKIVDGAVLDLSIASVANGVANSNFCAEFYMINGDSSVSNGLSGTIWNNYLGKTNHTQSGWGGGETGLINYKKNIGLTADKYIGKISHPAGATTYDGKFELTMTSAIQNAIENEWDHIILVAVYNKVYPDHLTNSTKWSDTWYNLPVIRYLSEDDGSGEGIDTSVGEDKLIATQVLNWDLSSSYNARDSVNNQSLTYKNASYGTNGGLSGARLNDGYICYTNLGGYLASDKSFKIAFRYYDNWRHGTGNGSEDGTGNGYGLFRLGTNTGYQHSSGTTVMALRNDGSVVNTTNGEVARTDYNSNKFPLNAARVYDVEIYYDYYNKVMYLYVNGLEYARYKNYTINPTTIKTITVGLGTDNNWAQGDVLQSLKVWTIEKAEETPANMVSGAIDFSPVIWTHGTDTNYGSSNYSYTNCGKIISEGVYTGTGSTDGDFFKTTYSVQSGYTVSKVECLEDPLATLNLDNGVLKGNLIVGQDLKGSTVLDGTYVTLKTTFTNGLVEYDRQYVCSTPVNAHGIEELLAWRTNVPAYDAFLGFNLFAVNSSTSNDGAGSVTTERNNTGDWLPTNNTTDYGAVSGNMFDAYGLACRNNQHTNRDNDIGWNLDKLGGRAALSSRSSSANNFRSVTIMTAPTAKYYFDVSGDENQGVYKNGDNFEFSIKFTPEVATNMTRYSFPSVKINTESRTLVTSTFPATGLTTASSGYSFTTSDSLVDYNPQDSSPTGVQTITINGSAAKIGKYSGSYTAAAYSGAETTTGSTEPTVYGSVTIPFEVQVFDKSKVRDYYDAENDKGVQLSSSFDSEADWWEFLKTYLEAEGYLNNIYYSDKATENKIVPDEGGEDTRYADFTAFKAAYETADSILLNLIGKNPVYATSLVRNLINSLIYAKDKNDNDYYERGVVNEVKYLRTYQPDIDEKTAAINAAIDALEAFDGKYDPEVLNESTNMLLDKDIFNEADVTTTITTVKEAIYDVATYKGGNIDTFENSIDQTAIDTQAASLVELYNDESAKSSYNVVIDKATTSVTDATGMSKKSEDASTVTYTALHGSGATFTSIGSTPADTVWYMELTSNDVSRSKQYQCEGANYTVDSILGGMRVYAYTRSAETPYKVTVRRTLSDKGGKKWLDRVMYVAEGGSYTVSNVTPMVGYTAPSALTLQSGTATVSGLNLTGISSDVVVSLDYTKAAGSGYDVTVVDTTGDTIVDDNYAYNTKISVELTNAIGLLEELQDKAGEYRIVHFGGGSLNFYSTEQAAYVAVATGTELYTAYFSGADAPVAAINLRQSGYFIQDGKYIFNGNYTLGSGAVLKEVGVLIGTPNGSYTMKANDVDITNINTSEDYTLLRAKSTKQVGDMNQFTIRVSKNLNGSIYKGYLIYTTIEGGSTRLHTIYTDPMNVTTSNA